ncbi:MAG: glycerophosphodiester phosphodiesterase family protein [Pseudomonadota bacterium]
MRFTGFIAISTLILAGCGGGDTPSNSAAKNPAASSTIVSNPSLPQDRARALPLQDYFDCLREEGGVVLAAHRGGPVPGYPENALETLQFNFDAGIVVSEIDIAESRDGVLFLMHDRTLGRTTTAGGPVVDTDWDAIARTRLVDNGGTETRFHPPKLTDVLLWAVETGAIVELDRKSSTSFRNIVSAVRAAGAVNNAILISYNDNDAGEIARLAPDMMLTASARGSRDIARLEDIGVDPENLIAWLGTNEPDAAAARRVLEEGVEPAFGTLGRSGERLDDLWLADGDASEFQDLIDDGHVLIATDRPLEIAPQISADELATTVCWR